MDGLGWTIIARYLENSCTAAERDAVERWASENPRNREELESVRRTWIRAALLPSGRRIDAMFDELSARMQAPTPDSVESQSKIVNSRDPRPPGPLPQRLSIAGPRANPFRRIGAIAAVVLAAALLSGGWYLGRLRPSESKAFAAPVREYATARGQQATIQLSDGSQLTLAAASRLRIPADFGKDSREVSLDGEALFDVVHDPDRPFRVHIKDAVAEDIGTRFDVRSYSEDTTVIVAVEEGAVALGRDRALVGESGGPRQRAPEGVVLRGGEAGTLGRDGRVTTISIAPELYSAWTKGKLEFIRSPLSEVAQSIGRWYDLDVRVEGKALAADRVTATFSVQSPAEMLQTLALAVNARVERSGRVVRLISNRQ